MKKMKIMILVFLMPVLSNADLTNIERGKAFSKGFMHSQIIRGSGYDKKDIDKLCVEQLEKENDLEGKTEEELEVILSSCINSLKI